MLSPGAQLGQYELRSLLGKGGMGEVYQAHDPKLGRDVAIKVLPEQFARDPERLIRFQREAKMLAALNHPNIAAIYGLEEFAGVHYLIMELVPGETLRDRILRDGALPVEEALKISKTSSSSRISLMKCAAACPPERSDAYLRRETRHLRSHRPRWLRRHG
jgi:serine/threonine protein kinase